MRLSRARTTPPFDRILFLASRWTPKFRNVLLIESGSRLAAEKFLVELYGLRENERVDVLTCYSSPPKGFDTARGRVYFTHEAHGAARSELFRIFARSGYSATCLLCTGDSIMTKWKWAAALRVPAKVLIVNENADSFWLDRGHLRNVRAMLVERSGVREMAPLRWMGQALAFPVTLTILLCFAGYMEAKRMLAAERSGHSASPPGA